MAAGVVINPLLSTFNMRRSIIKTQGMLPEELLDDGKQTPYYFYWEVDERSVWRLKTMEEFYHDTGYRHENLDTFHSFDDILIAFQDCLHTVAFRLQHPSIILEQRILEVRSWTAQRAMKKSVVPFDIYLQSSRITADVYHSRGRQARRIGRIISNTTNCDLSFFIFKMIALSLLWYISHKLIRHKIMTVTKEDSRHRLVWKHRHDVWLRLFLSIDQ